MSGEERRAAIVEAVLPLFARQGFANTTTKKLAEVAGVSEALIYKHFPSKESLYTEIQNLGCTGKDPGLEKLTALDPSTSTLVYILYYFLRSVSVGKCKESINWEMRHRMLLNSCLEDGSYTRFLFQNRVSDCFNKMVRCIEVSIESGDMVPSCLPPENRIRFAHHVAAMIAIMHLPTQPVIEYGVSKQDLLHQVVWFALRGMGMKDDAIARHFDPKALEIFFGSGEV